MRFMLLVLIASLASIKCETDEGECGDPSMRPSSNAISLHHPPFDWRFLRIVGFDNIMKECCEAGEQHAEQENSCKNFVPPNVNAEFISSCIYSSEICCQSKVRVEKCKGGVLAAMEGMDCHATTNETGSEFFKNCCESCKIGLVFGTMSVNCTLTHQYPMPFDEALIYCCKQAKKSKFIDEDSKCLLLFLKIWSD